MWTSESVPPAVAGGWLNVINQGINFKFNGEEFNRDTRMDRDGYRSKRMKRM
jgi:hypothetical protein